MNARKLLAALTFLLLTNTSMAKSALIYVATQNPEKMGIALAELDLATGALSAPKLIAETRDPSFFTLTEDGRHLYMCNSGTPGGISAFEVDRNTAALRFQNFVESRGRGPSHVSVDGSGRFVLDANYGGGHVEVLGTNKDGSLDKQTAFAQHSGSSVHPRQDKPYAHWIRTDPSNKFALVADLGMDQIVVYRFDAKTGALEPNDPPFVKVTPGMGPRHLAFHPNGKWVYAVQELSNEVVALKWDAARGALSQIQVVKTLADGFKDPNTAAEIAVRSDGRYVYVSNRGEDSIVVFAVDASSGELTFRQRVPSSGKVPRYFALDPEGRWLVVGNQETGNLVVFQVDEKTGELAQRGAPVPFPRPTGIVFAK